MSLGVTQDVSSSTFKRLKLPGNKDPLPVFMEEEVQSILNRITGVDLKKAAEIQPTLKPNKPVFKVIPEKELRRVGIITFYSRYFKHVSLIYSQINLLTLLLNSCK